MIAGPIERTVAELARISREASFRHRHSAPARSALRDSDHLMTLIEETLEGDHTLIPAWLWSAVAKIVSGVDGELRDELGIDRRPTHVASILFRAQEALMHAAHLEGQPRLAPIIPLFER